ncbi:oligosaccharide flippase family protein [Marinobacterium jannaschii]|uniref:oligosaccharide flippase family protein n=1 Tax=Marinobacterium jannaschii TaxID=64970 RepID=UPI00048174BC|nr:oligosaccharide flippase family protein [Marinobacterium jannaschii]
MSHPNASDSLSPDYFRKGSLVLFLGVFIGFAADYGFNLTLSNALPSHEYGDYKVAYAFAAITSVLVLLGGDRVAPRFLSASLSRGDNRPVWEFLRFYLLIAAGLSLAVFLCTAAGAVLHIGSTDLQDHHPLLLISLVIPFIAIGALLSRILQAAKRLALSNLPWRIALPLLKTGLVLLLVAALSEIHLWQVIASATLAVWLIIGWQWHKIRQLKLLTLQRAPQTFAGASVLKLSVPMMLAMLITLALNQIDLFMLEMLANEQDVGHFAAAATTAHLLPVAQVTIAGLFLPLIAPALEQGRSRARALFWQGQKAIAITVLSLTLLLLLGGPWLLSFFGNDFLLAEQALHYLVAGYALWALAAFASTWLQYGGQGHVVVMIGCATLLIDAGGNYWLISRYGIDGAAMATCLSMGFAALATWTACYRHLHQADTGGQPSAT